MRIERVLYFETPEQYSEWKANGGVEFNGEWVERKESDLPVVPDKSAEQIKALQEKTSDEAWLDKMYPVNSRYIQFPDMEEPLDRFGIGTWELDDKAMDKFLVGAGNLYALGATGGSADAVVVEHKHGGIYAIGNPDWEFASNTNIGGTHEITHAIVPDVSVNETGATTSGGLATGEAGEDGMGKNLPPYLAVKIWKRKS